MKNLFILLFINIVVTSVLEAQRIEPNDRQKREIISLIDKYSEAREKMDTVLLKGILSTEIDQLVSTGEWRNGISASVEGMLKSSAGSPGKRTLTVDKIRLLSADQAIVDCKYEITNSDATIRKMWSTFIVVSEKGLWKITAIRNMLPAKQ